jgi:hypothetical protein
LNYINNILPQAIQTQWIITAVGNNISDLKDIRTSINHIYGLIDFAENNTEKSELNALITQIKSWIHKLWDSYKTAVWINGRITAAEIVSQNLDLTNLDTLNIREEIVPSERWEASNEILDFFEISVQPIEEIIEIYKWEFIRQLGINREEFIAIPAEQIYVLKQQTEKRKKLLTSYNTLFEEEYDEVEFQKEIRLKKQEIDTTQFSLLLFGPDDTGKEILNNFYSRFIEPDKTFIVNALKNPITTHWLLESLKDLSDLNGEIAYNIAGEDRLVTAESKEIARVLLSALNETFTFLIS